VAKAIITFDHGKIIETMLPVQANPGTMNKLPN
jgi:hypothetical protein